MVSAASESTVLNEIMELNWQENRSEYAILIHSAGKGSSTVKPV